MSTDPTKQTTERRLRCVAVVWKRDTYRYTGRNKSGFEMYYSKKQCSRAATCPDRLCRQHAAMCNPLTLEPAWHEHV